MLNIICKHHLYGYKVKESVSSLEFAVHGSPFYSSSKADITISKSKLEKHKQYTKKHDDSAASVTVVQPQNSNQPWAILFDKRYIEIEREIVAVVLKENPPKQLLIVSEMKCNADKSTDQIIVKNLFGYLVRLWTVFLCSIGGRNKI